MLNLFGYRKKYVLDKSTDVGKYRETNEDSVTTLVHPKNNKIKLLAVADGMGGLDKGAQASQFVISTIERWFQSESEDLFHDYRALTQKMRDIIRYINYKLYGTEIVDSNCGSTLTCAIVTETDTIIANIGDSRAYKIDDYGLEQLTDDDSFVWSQYVQQWITKDQIRFHVDNNLITNFIGMYSEIEISFTRINNHTYNGLILLTDGVTDCLSDRKLSEIIRKSRHNNIANAIIHEAVYVDQNDSTPIGRNFQEVIAGKDNASVAVLIKK